MTAPKLGEVTTDCIFTNSAGRGTIIINKAVTGADGTFTFNGDWAGAYPDVRHRDSERHRRPSGRARRCSAACSPAPTAVDEVVPAGYALTGLTCAELKGDDGTTSTATTGTLDVDAGETGDVHVHQRPAGGRSRSTKTVTSGPELLVSGDLPRHGRPGRCHVRSRSTRRSVWSRHLASSAPASPVVLLSTSSLGRAGK